MRILPPSPRSTGLAACLLLAGAAGAPGAPPPLYTFTGTAAGDRLGTSVGGAGDVDGDGFADLVVGAPGDDDNGVGAGKVRVRSGRDGRVLLTFVGDGPGDALGTSVSGAGDVDGDGFADVIAGAPLADANGADAGSARVVSGASGATLHTFVGAGAGDQLGWSVGGAGDVDADGRDDLIVGAPLADAGGADAGAVRVLSGATGAVLHTFVGAAPGDLYGWSVGGAGDVDGDGHDDVVVGAPGHDAGGADAGAVEVRSGRTGGVLWSFVGDGPGDRFGWSVGGAGDVNGDGRPDLIAGAPLDDDGGADAGRVRVLSGADGTALWQFDGDAAGDHLGWSVGGAGDVDGDGRADLVAGAPLHEAGNTDAGCVRVWSGSDGALLHEWRGALAHDHLGWSVAGAGDVDGAGHDGVIAGAPGADVNGVDSGLALVFDAPPYEAHAETLIHAPTSAISADFGAEIRIVGDVNRDGKPDYGVGAINDAGGLGTVRVYSGDDHSLLHTFTGAAPSIFFGTRIGAAGDLDRDGHADVIVGAIHWDTALQDVGTAIVFSGRDGSVLQQFVGTQFRSHMGTAVGGLGDVDGDGVDDVFVGLGIHANGAGAVWVMSGATGQRIWEVTGNATGEWLGWYGAAVGDLDGDGVCDLIAGAPSGQVQPTPGRGYALVLSGATGAILHTLRGVDIQSRFGWRVDALGDVDGDGAGDVIVGGDGHDPGGRIDAGKAMVFSGRTGALLYELDGEVAGDAFGKAVSGAGDVNGDGFPDFLVGAPGYDPSLFLLAAGRAYLYSGRDGALLRTIDGRAILDTLGSGLSGIGDSDGDGYGDFAVGVPLDDRAGTDAGSVRIWESVVGTTPGSLRTYGAGCVGSAGGLPRLGFGGRPVLGRTFDVGVRAAPPGAPAALGFDAQRRAFALATVGAPGCTALAYPVVAVPTATGASGRASLTFTTPLAPSMVGASLYVQWILRDGAANALGHVFSNAGQLTFGTP